MNRKAIIFLADGMADEPLPELGGKTPLEAANTPAMDSIAREGVNGTFLTLPEGLPTSSDVANMSVLGFYPERNYPGRGPIEAVSQGIELGPDDVAFRCNLVYVSSDGIHHADIPDAGADRFVPPFPEEPGEGGAGNTDMFGEKIDPQFRLLIAVADVIHTLFVDILVKAGMVTADQTGDDLPGGAGEFGEHAGGVGADILLDPAKQSFRKPGVAGDFPGKAAGEQHCGGKRSIEAEPAPVPLPALHPVVMGFVRQEEKDVIPPHLEGLTVVDDLAAAGDGPADLQ